MIWTQGTSGLRELISYWKLEIIFQFGAGYIGWALKLEKLGWVLGVMYS